LVNNAALRRTIHPVHAVLLAGSLPLFLGALLSDLAYSSSYQVQWANFASWLLAGGLVLEGPALLWSLVRLLRPEVRRDRRWLLFVVFLAATFILGFVNSLVHAKDAWAMMPEAIFLSVIVFLLGCAATWLGFSRFGKEEV
jgi:uncharacterized membrane protein